MSADGVISLVLPTRGRVALAQRMLQSVRTTARRPEAIQVVLYLDADDAASHALSCEGLVLDRIIGPGGRMGAITQASYAACRGDYIMLVNDDVIFRTPGWDARVRETFARFADGVGLAWGNDLFQGPVLPSHPILSRAACEVMGGVCPADYDRDSIDKHIFDIFRRLGERGHARAVYLPDVVVEHLHPEAGKGKVDETYRRRNPSLDEFVYLAWAEEREALAAALAAKIEGHGRFANTDGAVSSVPPPNLFGGANNQRLPAEAGNVNKNAAGSDSHPQTSLGVAPGSSPRQGNPAVMPEINPPPPCPPLPVSLWPMALGMLRRQITTKRRAAQRARRPVSERQWLAPLRKLAALGAFLRRIAPFNRWQVHACRGALASLGGRQIVLYGGGEACRILSRLAARAGVKIVAACSPEHGPAPADVAEVWTRDQLARWNGPILIASFVNIAKRLDELESLGVPRERVTVLR